MDPVVPRLASYGMERSVSISTPGVSRKARKQIARPVAASRIAFGPLVTRLVLVAGFSWPILGAVGCAQVREHVAGLPGIGGTKSDTIEATPIPQSPEGYVGVDIGRHINSAQRAYTSFEDVVHVDPATLSVHFSDGRVTDAAGVTRDTDGTYHRQNRGRYANLAVYARRDALKAYPDRTWANLRQARQQAQAFHERRVATAKDDARAAVVAASRERGYEATERTFFDPSGGRLIDQHRLHPDRAVAGKRYLAMPLEAIRYTVEEEGVQIDRQVLESASLERRLLAFDADGTLRVWTAGGVEDTEWWVRGEYGEPLLGVELRRPIGGLGGTTLGVSRVNVDGPQPSAPHAAGGSDESAKDAAEPTDPTSRRARMRRARADAPPPPPARLARPLLALTDGRTDGGALARTSFYAVLRPVEDPGEFEDLAQAQLDFGTQWRQAIEDRHAAGQAVEVLDFPTWKTDFGGTFTGPQTRAQADAVLRKIYAGQDVEFARHMFIAFQFVWADMHPDPGEPVETFVHQQDGYEVRNGFGVIVSKQEPVVDEVVFRARYAQTARRVYPDVMVMDEIGLIRRITLGLRPLVRYFYAYYPPGTPTAELLVDRLHEIVKAGY